MTGFPPPVAGGAVWALLSAKVFTPTSQTAATPKETCATCEQLHAPENISTNASWPTYKNIALFFCGGGATAKKKSKQPHLVRGGTKREVGMSSVVLK